MGGFVSGGAPSGSDVIGFLHLFGELQDALQGGAQTAISLGAAIVAIVCLAFCVWGYKLTKVLFAILCFLIGLCLGLAIVGESGSGSTGVGLFVGALIGAGLAYLSKYIYKALVFLVNGGMVVLLFILFSSDSTMGAMSMLGVALGVVVGFFAVKYMRFFLILSTSLVYGLAAGTSVLLVAGVANPGMGLLLGAVLVVFGFHYQWKTTGGGTFRHYFLMRKTEAEQEKQVARGAAKLQTTDNDGIVSAKRAAIPTDLLGVPYFSQAGAYAAIPLGIALVLPFLPHGPAIQVVLITLCVAAGVHLSPCLGMGMVVCSRLFLLFRILPLLQNGVSVGAFVGSFAASFLFVAIVSIGCRRFPGILKHILVFAGAGVVAEFVLLFTQYDHYSDHALFFQILVPFLWAGLCAAAVAEFAMSPIIKHLPVSVCTRLGMETPATDTAAVGTEVNTSAGAIADDE